MSYSIYEWSGAVTIFLRAGRTTRPANEISEVRKRRRRRLGEDCNDQLRVMEIGCLLFKFNMFS